MSGDVRVLLVKAELKSMELSSTNLGPKRGFTVAESLLWIALCGLRFDADVAAMVSLEEVLKGLSKLAAVKKRSPPPSVTAIIRPPPLLTT